MCEISEFCEISKKAVSAATGTLPKGHMVSAALPLGIPTNFTPPGALRVKRHHLLVLAIAAFDDTLDGAIELAQSR
jgi:hypothetical protein